MSEQHHHNHHHHRKDSASIFKERTLKWIAFRKIFERVLKIALIVIAILMAIAVVVVYTIK